MSPDLPSLNALRAFESAARCGSFVQAAAELGVSAAAVSQQVRGLESRMGRQLFLRQGNRILLTDAGREIYPALEQAFREIATIARHADTSRTRKRLTLSVLPWLAAWVTTTLHGFDLPLIIRTEADPVALTLGEADLRLTYGAALYPDHKVTPLFTDHMVTVESASPQPNAPLIHIEWGAAYASLPGWPLWHSQRNLPMPDPETGYSVNDPLLALSMASQGLGRALLPRLLATATPGLRLTETGLTLPWPYALICLNARARNRPLSTLIAHLSQHTA